MRISKPFKAFLVPFSNLTLKARVVQIIRLLSSLLGIVILIVMMVGSSKSGHIYVSRIRCAHLDVAYGLYKSLRDSVSSQSSFQVDSDLFPVDQTLTNSEIEILTKYAQSQVSGAPQFIKIYLWRPCFGYYNTTEHVDSHGNIEYVRNSDLVRCLPNENYFIFDYRTMLNQVGLRSILSYAFESSDFDDSSYMDKVRHRHKMYTLIVNTIYVAVISQGVVFLMTIIAYANKGDDKEFRRKYAIFLHILSTIAVVSFLSFSVGLGLLTRFLVVIASEISKTLGDFGIELRLGPFWFSLSWIALTALTISMLSWGLPLWCANPVEVDDHEFDSPNLNPGVNYGGWNRNIPKSLKRSSTSGVFLNDKKDFKDGGEEHNLSGVYEVQTDSKDSIYEHDEEYEMESATELPDKSLTEETLRKLGETLSRKSSVRHLRYKKNSRIDYGHTIAEEETRNLLYNEQHTDMGQYPRNDVLANHYREETYDGYTNSGSRVSRDLLQENSNPGSSTRVFRHETIKSNSSKGSKKDPENFTASRSGSFKENKFQHNPNNNPFLTNREKYGTEANRSSFLNEDEMEILDNNFYINRM